jgi:hypothetical protein
MKESSPIRDIAIGLATLAIAGAGLYWFIALLIDKIASIEGDLGKTLVTTSATILLAVLSLVGGKLWEQRLKIRDDIRSRKIPVYEKQIATFFSAIMSEKIKGKKISDRELAKAFTEFSEKLIVWGSSEVIQVWVKFRTTKFEGAEGLKTMEDLFLAIRKDLGNDNANLKNHELLRLFVNDLDANGNPPEVQASPKLNNQQNKAEDATPRNPLD